MKTLDEVITAFDNSCARCGECPYCEDKYCRNEMDNDALHYLKDMKNLEVDYDILYKKYWREFNQQQENPALTWDELRTMEGKPVWVEALLYKQWAVIAYIGEEYIRFEGANLYAPECRIYMGEDNGWQAYRKERE